MILGFLAHRFFFHSSVFHGPYSREMTEPIFLDPFENKCFKFEVQTFICPPSLTNKKRTN